MSWGNLAAVLAQGMRGKRAGEDRQYARDQDILATQRENAGRQEEARYRAAQLARQAQQDALANEMMRLRIAAEQREAAAPPPDRRELNPITGQPWTSPDEKFNYERRLAGSRRAPVAAPPPGESTGEIAREDARRRALVAVGERRLRELPRDVLGNPLDIEMAGRLASVRDSVAAEIGAPAPDTRVDPFAGLQGGPAAGGLRKVWNAVTERQTTPPPPTTMDPEELAAARAEVAGKGWAPDVARERLAAAGFTAPEIAQILGGNE